MGFRLFGRKTVRLPEDVIEVSRAITANGHQVYVVGGGVRDALLGLPVSDWDLTTDAHPDEILKLFPNSRTTGRRFGTITVNAGSLNLEITTMRTERGYSDFRHPDEVHFTNSITEDLARRDFTVNAIAYDPLNRRFVDPFQGRRDLGRKLLRCVGEPRARFREDALRMVRLYRFAAVLEFRIDPLTHGAVQAELVRGVSAERIQAEMTKMLLAKRPSLGLLPMNDAGLLAEIIPELSACEGVPQGGLHKHDVLYHLIEATDAARPDLAVRWACLLHDIAKPLTRFEDDSGLHFYGHDEIGAAMARRILARLKYPSKLMDRVELLVREHMFSVHHRSTDKALRKLIARVGRENIMDLLDVRQADVVAMRDDYAAFWPSLQQLRTRILELLEGPIHQVDLAVDGRDVMEALGIGPGPEVGDALDWLLEQVLENPVLNNRDTLLQLLKEKHTS